MLTIALATKQPIRNANCKIKLLENNINQPTAFNSKRNSSIMQIYAKNAKNIDTTT